jgi:hypothetical protein
MNFPDYDYLDQNPPESPQSNYPIEEDDAFTLDEIEAIKAYKKQLQKKIDGKYSINRVIEQTFWGVTSYSLCRWLVITSGGMGFNLAIAVALLLNNIVNRDCFDSFSINKNSEGWEITGMGKLLKFTFSSAVAGFILWSAAGDFLYMARNSEQTYKDLQATVEDFNRLPDDNKNLVYVGGAVLALGAIATIVSGLKGDS